jgi:mRNA interferase MazF
MIALRSDIWLANLNPSKKANEIGKIRPVLIFQNDEINRSSYPTTVILPLTTVLIDEAKPLRFRVNKRDKLNKNSDVLIAHIRSIDNIRLIEKIASLTKTEMTEIKELLAEVLVK